MAHLQEIANEISKIYETRSSKSKTSIRIVKGLLLAGAVAAGIAHFFPSNDIWHVVGIMGAIVVFISGIIVAVVEPDPGAELERARSAIEAARDIEREFVLRRQP